LIAGGRAGAVIVGIVVVMLMGSKAAPGA